MANSDRCRTVTAATAVRVASLFSFAALLIGCGVVDGMHESAPTTDGSSRDRSERITTTSRLASTTTVTSVPPTAPPTTAPVPPATTAPPPRPSLAGRVIVVDPGHNGANGAHPTEINRLVDAGGFQKACNTTGTAAGGLTESRFNWDTAQLVRARLEALGATVVLTRSSDDGWGPCIDQRGATAKQADADVLVSIHADGADAGSSGFHVIRPAAAGVVTAATSSAASSLATAVRDGLVAEGLTTSSYLGVDGIDERSDLGTLNLAGVPAVMLESGNMHNESDFAILNSAAGRERIADGLAQGIAAYLG